MGKEFRQGIAKWLMYQYSTRETKPGGYMYIKRLIAKNWLL